MAARCFIIAEAGVNHNGSVRTAKRLIEAAKRAGADAVKFQSFKAEKIASAAAALAPYQKKKMGGGSQVDMIRRLELGVEDHERLLAHCRKVGIRFMSTPFDEESADLLQRLGVDRFKLPSGEITNKALLQHVAAKGRPIILSTGMSTLKEVGRAVGWIRAKRKTGLSLLHCVSEYPAPLAQVNLRAMDTMRKAFKLPVGYSDHTLGIEIAVAAVARGAEIIEKHFTLDSKAPGPDHAASIEPEEFKSMVVAIRNVESALGDEIKRMALCERRNREAVRRSLVAARDLPRGHRLRRGDLTAKRPGSGIPPEKLAQVLGKSLRRPLRRDQVLTREKL